jgi:phosphoglycerate dehydrogenase-like enzyme
LAKNRGTSRHPGRVGSGKRKGEEMKIVVIGGTGLIGSKLVEKLRRAGHEPLAASPPSPVFLLLEGHGTATRKGGCP